MTSEELLRFVDFIEVLHDVAKKIKLHANTSSDV
jgi:hypothetical protein